MEKSNKTQSWQRSWTVIVLMLVGADLGIAYIIGAGEVLKNNDGRFLAPIAITAVVPVVLFLVLYLLSARTREMVWAVDIKLLTMMQMWRVIGFAFLPLYAFGILPGLFSWPAGLGDVAIGIVAVIMVTRINSNKDYILSAKFMWFNVVGLLDFAVAVMTAGLAAGSMPRLITNGITSAPMDVWPLNIFPSFFVPVFIIIHLSVMLKTAHLRKIRNQATDALPQTV